MPQPIPTLQDEWRKYRDAVYPRGTSAVQNRETHQAFFAGALVALVLANKCSEHPDERLCVAAFDKLMREAKEVNAARAHQAEARN